MYRIEGLVVLIIIFFIITAPVALTIFFAKKIPGLRYFPSALLAVTGLLFSFIQWTAPPSGGGDWTRTSDSSMIFALIILAVFLFFSVIIFVVAYLTYNNSLKASKHLS